MFKNLKIAFDAFRIYHIAMVRLGAATAHRHMRRFAMHSHHLHLRLIEEMQNEGASPRARRLLILGALFDDVIKLKKENSQFS